MRAPKNTGHSSMNDEAARDAVLLEIAERHFFLETLETRNSDSLDFHDSAVWAIRSALLAAFEAGRRAGAANTQAQSSKDQIMAIAVPSDTTRIFIDRQRFVQAMSPATLQGHFNDLNLNSEVFEMAGRIGIDCLTIELADVVPVLQQHGLI